MWIFVPKIDVQVVNVKQKFFYESLTLWACHQSVSLLSQKS